MRNVQLSQSITLVLGMIRRVRFVGGCLLVALLLCSITGCKPDGRSAEYLFVQTADQVTFKDNIMTLHGVSPTTLFFSDRPERITGHQGTRIFVENWSEGNNSFASDPPNAALIILGDEDTEVAEIVVELKNPKSANNSLSYGVTVLDGNMPPSGGASALFIDAVIITDPMVMYPEYGPLSYRGQSRRVARRTARRVSRRR